MIGKKRKGNKLEEITNEDNEHLSNENIEEKKEISTSNKLLWIQDVKILLNFFLYQLMN